MMTKKCDTCQNLSTLCAQAGCAGYVEKKTGIPQAAETLASMCVDFISGGIDKEAFAQNLSAMSVYCNKKLGIASAEENVCRNALSLILDCVDYTEDNCSPRDMVSAVLSVPVLKAARVAIIEEDRRRTSCSAPSANAEDSTSA